MAATSIETTGLAAVTIPSGTAEAQLPTCYDIDFRQRLTLIGTLVAIAVLNETGGTTNRSDYARVFLADPASAVAKSLCFAVPADGVTGTGLTDQEIANRIGDLWNTLGSGF